jgi:hypothetical protein
MIWYRVLVAGTTTLVFGTYLLELIQHVLGLYGRVGLDDDRLGGNVGGDIRHSCIIVE